MQGVNCGSIARLCSQTAWVFGVILDKRYNLKVEPLVKCHTKLPGSCMVRVLHPPARDVSCVVCHRDMSPCRAPHSAPWVYYASGPLQVQVVLPVTASQDAQLRR